MFSLSPLLPPFFLTHFFPNHQYNVVINSLAKSGGKDAAKEAEKLLGKMHKLYEEGDLHVKPNVVTYGAVIDAYAKSGEKYAAARADTLLAKMIHLNQMDPVTNSDLQPNTYVFNTVINAHAKSKEVRGVYNVHGCHALSNVIS
mgnify:CR=1 FL=1